MTHTREKIISRNVDLIFMIPPGITFWRNYCHKLILCARVLPIIRRTIRKEPWVIRGRLLYNTCKAYIERDINIYVGEQPRGPTFVEKGLFALSK